MKYLLLALVVCQFSSLVHAEALGKDEFLAHLQEFDARCFPIDFQWTSEVMQSRPSAPADMHVRSRSTLKTDGRRLAAETIGYAIRGSGDSVVAVTKTHWAHFYDGKTLALYQDNSSMPRTPVGELDWSAGERSCAKCWSISTKLPPLLPVTSWVFAPLPILGMLPMVGSPHLCEFLKNSEFDAQPPVSDDGCQPCEKNVVGMRFTKKDADVTVWLNPAKGFCPVHISADLKRSAYYQPTPPGEPDSVLIDIAVTRIEKVDDVDLPTAGDYATFSNGDKNMPKKTHIEIIAPRCHTTCNDADFTVHLPPDTEVSDASTFDTYQVSPDGYTLVKTATSVRELMDEIASIAIFDKEHASE